MLRKIQIFLFVVALFTFFLELPISKATSNIDIDTFNELETTTTSNGQRNVFLYFAFGSNLLDKRLLIQNPTAIRVDAAALKNYRLDFDQLNLKWRGARATILPDRNSTVFGIVWEIDQLQLENLDRQEGVDEHIYAPMNVSVELLSNGKIVTARTYYLADGVPEDSKFDRRPSITYLKCIVKGAKEGNLPLNYINYLQTIEHNGIIAPTLEEKLQLEDFEMIDSKQKQINEEMIL